MNKKNFVYRVFDTAQRLLRIVTTSNSIDNTEKAFPAIRELLNISFVLAAVSCQDSWVIFIPSAFGHDRINPEHGAVYKFENP